MCVQQLMHESSPDCVSFRFDHPKLLEIVIERLYVHGSTCAPHEDDQFDCPSRALSFCLLCYCFKAFLEHHAELVHETLHVLGNLVFDLMYA